MSVKSFLLKSKNVERDSYLWNTMGGLLRGFRSVVFLMILNRTVGLVMAGIYTLANANSNLYLLLGNYNMRNFHVSDVKREFTFRDYLSSRWVTIGAMGVVSLGHILISGYNYSYSMEKIQILVWMCLFKIPDALEDAFLGEFQRNGRMDIGAKIMTLRVMFTMMIFSVTVIISRKLLFSIVVSTIFTLLVLLLFLWCVKEELPADMSCNSSADKILNLLRYCFPVFIAGFLSIYITNVPKYAIDATMTDEFQAYYGIISMPVLMIDMINGFICGPAPYYLAQAWSDGNLKGFVKKASVLIAIVTGVAGVSVVGLYYIGIPVLTVMYGVDISRYKVELLVLTVASGFAGVSNFMAIIVTIMRMQKKLIYIYGIVAITALLLSQGVVLHHQIMGAAVLITFLEILLCLFLAIVIICNLCKHERIER